MIQNVWAVGRNYSDHAKELGNTVPENPLIFLKAASTVTLKDEFSLPTHSDDVHHEPEIALRFGPDLEFDAAHLALDLTARDLQNKLKAAGQPWTLAKSFKESCPLSKPMPLPPAIPHFEFELKVKGEVHQRGNTRDIWFLILKHFAATSLNASPFALAIFFSPVRPSELPALVAAIKFSRQQSRWLATSSAPNFDEWAKCYDQTCGDCYDICYPQQ